MIFYNPDDYALTGSSWWHPGWEWDQSGKPNSYDTPYRDSTDGGSSKYYYTISTWIDPTGVFYYYWRMFDDEDKKPVQSKELVFDEDRDTYEIFSFVAGSYVQALGTTSVGAPFGEDEVDISGSEYGFTDELKDHSGQFKYSLPEKFKFWKTFFAKTKINSLIK